MMQCELCHRDSGKGRLCSVCGEAVQRVLQISAEKKHQQVSPEPGKSRGNAATAGS